MKAVDKPKYVSEARELYEAVDIEKLASRSDDLNEIKKINRLIAIFVNFSFNDGQDLKNLLQEYLKCARKSSSLGTIRNRVIDMMQFIGQKIEEMDIYVIDDKQEEKRKRIVKNLKNDKLWVRTSEEGKDFHIIIGERENTSGEHVHLILGETGEVRMDPDDKAPSSLIKKIVAITTIDDQTINASSDTIKTTVEFGAKQQPKEIPVLFVKPNFGSSGGPSGHFIYFTIKNISNETAIDIIWGMRGFGYEWRSHKNPFILDPKEEKEVEYRLTDNKPFNELVDELNVFIEYSDIHSNRYFARREIVQTKVPSGAFFELQGDKIGSYHPPVLLVDDGIKFEDWTQKTNGDYVESIFNVKDRNLTRKVAIRISRTLIATWGFLSEEEIKFALMELGSRKIKQMKRASVVNDFIFISDDFPQEFQQEKKGYRKLRNSLD